MAWKFSSSLGEGVETPVQIQGEALTGRLAPPNEHLYRHGIPPGFDNKRVPWCITTSRYYLTYYCIKIN
jgi:hypothetical protein